MELRADYISKENCNIIKGVFILLVFFRHFLGYFSERNGLIFAFDAHLGQLIVTMFLFYSGYGVAESFARKGVAYARDFPKKRILTTLLNFDVAVLAFVALDLFLGRTIGIRQVLMSFVCWDSVGNSNWYIFAIVCCYTTAWLLLGVLNLKKWGACVFVAIAIEVVFLTYVRPSYWYNTMMCFAAGVMFSQHRFLFEHLMKKFFWGVLVLSLLGFLLFRHCGLYAHGLAYNAQAIMFSLIIVMITMKIPIRGRALEWCGEHLFPIYIYQRIPMLIFVTLDPEGFSTGRAWLYFPICLAVTLLTAKWYHLWQIKL